MLVCPSCETVVPEEKCVETYTAPFNNQEYKLYHCPKCDLQWWEPLKIVPEFYEQEGEEGYTIFHMGIKEAIGEHHKMFFKHMPLKSGRLLDVGCGDGVFLVEAQKRGYEVWGIDFDRKSIQVCQEKRGLKNTFAMTPQEFAEFCQKKGLKFDIITFFEVLEHQDNPREFLKTVRDMLKPDGQIAGSVPNRNSLILKLQYMKPRSAVDYPPHHFMRFSAISLKNLFKLMGYDLVKISITPARLQDLAKVFQSILIKDTSERRIKRFLIGSELIGEGTTTFRYLPYYRRFIFKSLKLMRLLTFLPFVLPAKFFVQGYSYYFQGKPIQDYD